jgi:hypothetical protein
LGGPTRLLINGLIGSLDGGVESGFGFCFLGGARWRCKVCEEGVGGESAGDLSGGGSAHPVTDDERTGLRCSSAGVLIAMADAAAVGKHGVDEMVRRHSRWFNSPNKTIHGEAAETKGTLVLVRER